MQIIEKIGIDMKSQEHLLDFEVVQSDTKTFRFFVKRNHIPFDITGYEFFFTVKKSIKDTDANAVIAKQVICPANADSVAGKAYISLTSSDTNVPFGNYMYDIKMQLKINNVIISRKPVFCYKVL